MVPSLGLEIFAVRHATDGLAVELGLDAARGVPSWHTVGNVFEIQPQAQQHLGSGAPQRQPRTKHLLQPRCVQP